jgi:hypothetical protein
MHRKSEPPGARSTAIGSKAIPWWHRISDGPGFPLQLGGSVQTARWSLASKTGSVETPSDFMVVAAPGFLGPSHPRFNGLSGLRCYSRNCDLDESIRDAR